MANILKIKEICEITSGQSLRDGVQHLKDGQYLVLQYKNIGQYGVKFDEIERINLPEKTIPKLLSQNDVLLYTKFFRSNLPASALIDRPVEKLIAGPSFYVLKIKQSFSAKILPAFLTWYLGSKNHGGKYFLSSATGTSLLNVTKPVLEECEVSLPSVEEQDKFLQYYQCSIRELDLLNQLNTKRELLLEAISQKWRLS